MQSIDSRKRIAVKTLYQWIGGKQQLLDFILPLIPPHQTYVESFLGSGAVALHKTPAKRTVLSDINPGIIACWRSVRDNWRLFQLMAVGLHSRDNFADLMRQQEKNGDGVYALALNDLITAIQDGDIAWIENNYGSWASQFASELFWEDTTTKPLTATQESQFVTGAAFFLAQNCRFNGATQSKWYSPRLRSRYDTATMMLDTFAGQLQPFTILRQSYTRSLGSNDSGSTFAYLDPPYHVDTVNAGTLEQYGGNWSRDEQLKFLGYVKRSKCKIMISGYDNDDYRVSLRGWIIAHKHNHYSGASPATHKRRVTECLWMNY